CCWRYWWNIVSNTGNESFRLECSSPSVADPCSHKYLRIRSPTSGRGVARSSTEAGLRGRDSCLRARAGVSSSTAFLPVANYSAPRYPIPIRRKLMVVVMTFVIVVVLVVHVHRNRAAVLGNRAAHVLELHGSVRNVEPLRQHPVQ